MKTCGSCGESQSEENFSPRADRPGTLRGTCKKCIRERYDAQERKYRRYGITKSRYDEMFEDQGGRCAICKQVAEESLAIDHDHACCPNNSSCGECVRGLLCRNCNMAIGLLGDNIVTLLSAAEYLKP